MVSLSSIRLFSLRKCGTDGLWNSHGVEFIQREYFNIYFWKNWIVPHSGDILCKLKIILCNFILCSPVCVRNFVCMYHQFLQSSFTPFTCITKHALSQPQNQNGFLHDIFPFSLREHRPTFLGNELKRSIIALEYF